MKTRNDLMMHQLQPSTEKIPVGVANGTHKWGFSTASLGADDDPSALHFCANTADTDICGRAGAK